MDLGQGSRRPGALADRSRGSRGRGCPSLAKSSRFLARDPRGRRSFYRAHSAEADARRVAGAENLDQMKALAKSAAHWHPADYFPRAVVGIQLAAQGHCSEALPWLFQAMALHPTTP